MIGQTVNAFNDGSCYVEISSVGDSRCYYSCDMSWFPVERGAVHFMRFDRFTSQDWY